MLNRLRPKSATQAVPDGRVVCAIGDVHGCAEQLGALLASLTREGAQTLVFLGDYIDRGPDSAAVIASVRQIPDAVCLLGNHEAMFLAALDDPAQADQWLNNGGFATLDSFGIPPETPSAGWRAHLPAGVEAWLRALPVTHREGDVLFVHAGIRPGVPLEAQATEDLVWIREPFLSHRGPHPARVVHGHTVTEAPVLRANRIGVDTGAVLGGKLTAVMLEGTEARFVAV